MVNYLLIVAGLAILVVGAEFMVRGSVGLAKRLGLSTLLIGMTVVAFGTSAPELVVTVDAVLEGAPDVAVGNIIGSNIANLMLIIGTAAAIMPIVRCQRPLVFDAFILTAASLVFAGFCWLGVIPRWAGAVLVVGLAAFLVFSYRREKMGAGDPIAAGRLEETEELATARMPLWLALVATAGGLAGLVLGADMLVEGSIAVARAHGVSEAVIGLTLIAIGTSLPELGASVVAAIRKHSDIAVGNVIGSNLFNMLGVGGLAAVVAPLAVAPEIQTIHIWVMLAATAIFLPFIVTRIRCGRLAGAAFLVLYFGYIGWLAMNPGVEPLAMLSVDR